MAIQREYQNDQIRFAALREEMVSRLAPDLIENPQLADAIKSQIDELVAAALRKEVSAPLPPDKGLAQLAGIGDSAAKEFGETFIPHGVQVYDESVTSERMVAVGDLYYIFQHERIGIFRVMQKLQELFKAGAIQLSSGPGAFALYQFDRREVLRYTQRDRQIAYRRVFGYGNAPVLPNSRANSDFHHLFSHFVNQVTLYWRDKRISDVLRERSYDPTFGAIAVVRRAGLDLRNNLKFMSFGHLNVMRVEVMQLLDEAFRILEAPDIRNQFGADTAWDVVEEILVRHFNERLQTSPRQRMGVTGRDVLRWLAQPHILQQQRAQFEGLLLEIAEPSEEWLTSAQSLGLATRSGDARVLPWDREQRAAPSPAPRPSAHTNHRVRRPAEREFEMEYEY